MAIESKPLFHPEVIRQHVRGFKLPERALHSTLQHWADLIASGRADDFKETNLLPDFITAIFCNLLGYTRPAGPGDVFTLSREKHVEVDGTFADAVLGRFQKGKEQFVVALEGKGTRDPLDRPFAGRRMSAVDQAYRYAINLPCDWIIVTSMRETRLYHKGSNQHAFERFESVRLASDPALLKRFVFLLGAERVVPEGRDSHLYELLKASESVGSELTNQFYGLYADIRLQVLTRLRRENTTVVPPEILRCTQKLLDRVLFCAFCEDRGLLPADSLKHAFAHHDPYNPKPIWDNFRGLFRAIDAGNAGLNIPAYNGGLFAADSGLDALTVTDDVCGYFRDLGEYDYRPAREVADGDEESEVRSLIDVDILGHIFEQSITDLERLRLRLERGDGMIADADEATTRRKREGAFYTPAFITRYNVEQALGAVVKVRFEALRRTLEHEATGTARKALIDPNAYDLNALTAPQRKALIRFWETWQEELRGLRILDPACGSGAFLIEVFDQLHALYEISNVRLEDLRGHRTLFDLDRQILQHNLYGVDLNAEAIQICQLSLWIKTASRGKVLTSLDHTIREGNSVIGDPDVHPKALNWQHAFPEVFAQGGFDVVVGNPPYVRQELLTPYKPWLEAHYESFHGMADLYVYFYELGVRVLKPGGILSFIVTNKWMKAGYGAPLRRFFSEKAWVRSIVDFGHAKQIFEDADVFPCIIVLEKPSERPKPKTARLCTIPREQLRIDDLSVQIEREGFEISDERLGKATWNLEKPVVTDLLAKLRANSIPLGEFAHIKPLYGIKTGLNEAFLISEETRNRLVAEDRRSDEIVRPYLRGQDIGRWIPDWQRLWMIFTRRGIDINQFPAVRNYLMTFRERLEPKPAEWGAEDWPGRKGGNYKWFEIQDPVSYWQAFLQPKLCIQRIAFHSRVALDDTGMLLNDAAIILPTTDRWLLACLNSPAMWFFSFRFFPHKKDEALAMDIPYVDRLPIPRPSSLAVETADRLISRLMDAEKELRAYRLGLADWLRVEYSIEKPGNKLQLLAGLDSDTLIAEVKRIRGKKRPLTAAGVQGLRAEYTRTVDPARALVGEIAMLESSLSDTVNQAFGLTPQEIVLMWHTAPPRMPIAPPT